MIKKLVYRTFGLLSGLLPLGVKRKITNGGVLSGLIRKMLNTSVDEGLSVVTVTAGPLKGKRALLDMKNEKSRWLGTYEPELVDACRELIEPGMVIYDVGANIGYVSMLFAEFTGPEGKVLAFEPLPENAKRIRENVQLNNYKQIDVYENAVIDAERPVSFLRHRSVGMGKALGSAGRADQEYKTELTVHGIGLDDFVINKGNPIPDLIKIDIEGGEVMALPGMEGILTQNGPILMIELHGEESEQVAWRVLNACGYELYQMEDLSKQITSVDELKWKAYVVAIKKTV